MSLCQEACRRCASVALVLVLVVIALPSLLNAQTAPKAPTVQSDDSVPKVELFLGYQWLNPGGNVPDQSTPPLAFKLPANSKGFGTSVAYNFTKYVALEGDYGVNWSSDDRISTFSVGPKFTWRGEGVNFFVHTLL